MDFIVKSRHARHSRAWRRRVVGTFHGRLTIIAPLCVAIVVGSIIAVGRLAAGSGADPVDRPPSKACLAKSKNTEVLAVRKDTTLSSQWTRYAQTGTGWTGGDSVHAYRLSSSSILWSFADSFLGPVNTDGTRPYDAPLVHNLAVIQKGATFHLVVNGTVSHPTPLVAPRHKDDFYLALSGIVEGNRFQEFLMEIHRYKNGSFHWQQSTTVIATFSLPGFHLKSVVPVRQPNLSIQWGSYVMHQGRYVYIYGATATAVTHKRMYVARAMAGHLAGTWKYFDGSGWTPNPLDAAAVTSGVSEQYSVTPLDGVYILITSSVGTKYSSDVNVLAGCSPVGPFTLSSSFAASYHVGPLGQSLYHTSKVWVYEAMDQTALNRGSQFLITYNRNSLDYWNLFDSVNIYRPGYLWVTIGVGFKKHASVATGAG